MRYAQKHDDQTMVLSDKIQSGEWYVWLESESVESSTSLLLGICDFETAKKLQRIGLKTRDISAETSVENGRQCRETYLAATRAKPLLS